MCEVLVLGVEGAGKSTLIKALQAVAASRSPGELPCGEYRPTVGVDLTQLGLGKNKRRRVTLREVGGCMQRLWGEQLAHADALLYVLDVGDHAAIARALCGLFTMLNDPKLQGQPVCVALCKADLPSALLRPELDMLSGLQHLEGSYAGRCKVVESVIAPQMVNCRLVLKWLADVHKRKHRTPLPRNASAKALATCWPAAPASPA